MFQSTLLLLLTFCLSLVAADPVTACTTIAPSLPMPTLSSGIANPFFPCGIDKASVSACPFRCYSITETLTYTDATLLDACFTADQANALIDSLTHICVACVVPPKSQVPKSSSTGPTCQPVLPYFNNIYPSISPSKCGTLTQPLPECSWVCAAAQVPFSMCDTSNTAGTFRVCSKCLPQCSSPAIIFDVSTTPTNFSLSSGSCSKQYGPQEAVACPFRCTDPSSGGNSYCSLQDLTGLGQGFQRCKKCT